MRAGWKVRQVFFAPPPPRAFEEHTSVNEDGSLTVSSQCQRKHLTYDMGRQTPPREVGRRGEGPVVGAVANVR